MHLSSTVQRSKKCLVIVRVANDTHPEMGAGEEFLGNETEESFRELLASGLPVRMGLVAFAPNGLQLQNDLRPVFIVKETAMNNGGVSIHPTVNVA